MTTEAFSNEIAIIGMAGRFPGARNLDEYYQNLRNGVESITFFSDEQLRSMGVSEVRLADPNYVKAAPVLQEAEYFDADFFHYSVREARMLDPQQRCFLECAWEALENAGYSAERYDYPIGVFAGTSTNTYLLDNIINKGVAVDLDFMNFIGTYLTGDKDFLATRVSYKLNLTGPSFTLQSACSTSLVAVHTACQNLLNGECDMALAGAVTIRFPLSGYIYKPDGMVSPDGHCRAFDAQAQGTLFGSGLGIVVLKRLSDALEDGDHILAVIKGSALNNDGASKLSYTAPSLDRQSEVVAEALAVADVTPESIGYIEAHGTGTPIGDPVELTALTQVFREYTDSKQFCAIGSVKSNIGHLDVAAGMGGLLKLVLTLYHKQIFPSLHFTTPNPKIDLANSPFYVNTKLSPFKPKDDETPRRAAITSLGVGGTNAHLILEEAPNASRNKSEPSKRAGQLLLLSAKSAKALEQASDNLRSFLTSNPTVELADVAYTYQVGRIRFGFRRAIVCHDIQEAIERLEKSSAKQVMSEMQEEVRPVWFVLPDSDPALNRKKAWQLYQQEPIFVQQLFECVQAWNAIMEQERWLEPDLMGQWLQADKLDRMQSSFLNFALPYALAKLWIGWGVLPSALVAEGTGELVASCLADLLTLKEALTAMGIRERVIDGAKITQFRPTLASPTVPIFASRLNEWLSDEKVQDKWYWLKNSAPQRLSRGTRDWGGVGRGMGEGMEEDERGRALMDVILLEEAEQSQALLLSITFDKLSSGTSAAGSAKMVPSFSGSADKATEDLLHSLAHLWLLGGTVDWQEFYAQERRRRIPLPTYPFERQRYNFNEQQAVQRRTIPTQSIHQTPDHPLLHKQIRSPAIQKTIFESSFSLETLPYLDDHRVHGLPIVPASCHIAMVLSALFEVSGVSGLYHALRVQNLLFREALILPEEGARTVQLIVEHDKPESIAYKLISCATGLESQANAWISHSSGTMHSISCSVNAYQPISEIQARCSEIIERERFYRRGRQLGFEWEGDFRAIQKLWRRDGEALALIEHSAQNELSSVAIHPAILDACLQPYLALLPKACPDKRKDGPHAATGDAYIPLSIGHLRFYERPTRKLWSHVLWQPQKRESLLVDITLLNEVGKVFCEIEGLHLVRVSKETLRQATRRQIPQSFDFIYRPIWKATEIIKDAHQSPLFPEKAIVIVGLPDDPWDLAHILAQAHQPAPVFHVRLGESYRIDSDDGIVIRYKRQEDYARLMGELPPISTMYFLGGLPLEHEETELALLNRSLEIDVLSLFRLIKALLHQNRQDPFELKVITQDLQVVPKGHDIPEGLYMPEGHDIHGQEQTLTPYAGALIGLCKVIARENRHLTVSCLDLSVADLRLLEKEEQTKQDLIENILAEKGQLNVTEVALRRGQRFVKRLVKAPTPLSQSRQPLKEEGVVVILGGGKGIGLAIGFYLAEHYRARLVLVGRSPLDEEKKEHLQHIAELGGKAIYLSQDITDVEGMKKVITRAKNTFGSVQGVIHSAAVLSDGALLTLDEEDFVKALAPKVKGSVALYEAIKDEPLDFVVFFSSENSFRGNAGQSNYVAGCTFQDTYAQYLKHHQNVPAKVINWGYWGEVGMASNAKSKQLMQKRGLYPISVQEGTAIFEQVMGSAFDQLAPIKCAESLFEPLGIEPEKSITGANGSLEEPPPPRREPQFWGGSRQNGHLNIQALELNSLEERRERLGDYLRQEVIKTLQLEAAKPIDMKAPLSRLGMDSLIGIDFCNSLSKTIGKPLPTTLIFDYPSLQAILDYLTREVLGWEDSQPNSALPAEAVTHKEEELEESFDAIAELDELSVEELEMLLLQELES